MMGIPLIIHTGVSRWSVAMVSLRLSVRVMHLAMRKVRLSLRLRSASVAELHAQIVCADFKCIKRLNYEDHD